MAVKKQHSGVRRRRWTAKEMYRLLDLGFFNGQRVELIEGEIFVMASQKNFHAMGITLTEDALRAAFGPAYWVRVQMSLDLTPHSVPDPDLAVIAGNIRTHDPAHNPTSALLIVEVSATTLRFDQRRKASLYARCNIADYWILNLVDGRLEVYRNPVPDLTHRYGYRYADVTHLGPTDFVTPLALPQAKIAVIDLLP
ncbi:MAG TPA: Uma2 family endonuclease [Gemmataceae bacterium]|nr:Uma2 family endonuclease [Gemmataceae bacterium]